ncbi:glutamate-5-semialdehyde dehydrogenase [Hornefia butyriciproducens]|uniref:glutamate-5-semialdehyde dehydrogenase n=1 Tax=Hornefia butyriciproducens TaxID=2652293 RepID=UPI002A91F63E|nr:glutamate-5-semialdehyde dehydrogenase [Hornefia butyriciproducens]MDY5424236.1 glutamate-5-semialdehyde dehydrogenase [Hornefia butyriciproducens]MDY5463711.1 glutamate-5-semialdehyde dehydrogenase [Hornefia butyriciproducens]
MTELEKMGARAKDAAGILRIVSSEDKELALKEVAGALIRRQSEILEANRQDLAAAEAGGMPRSMLDRLALSEERIRGMADGVTAVSEWPDPVGRVLEEYDLPNGLHVRRVSVPLGVIGIIFEARPNVTSDCAALCIRAGNSCILRGGKEAFRTNLAVTRIMREALSDSPLPTDCVQLVTDTDRRSATEMMNLTEYLDVLIPRGGAGLIRSVVDNARVPVIETGAGNCHIYVDKAASVEMAAAIAVNAKTSRPSVCNAAEKLLVHREIADMALPVIGKRLREKEVELRGDDASREIFRDIRPATDDDWGKEYVDLIMGVRIVDSIEEAIRHIERWSTHHSDCIVTEDPAAAAKFQTEVDSAVVYHNASTRFTDGGELGLGAEIGISTQKLHARGPMGVNQLVTYKYIIDGNGQIR